MRVSIIRRAHFNAAHRLHNKNWSDEKNREVYGPCNSPNYHGHNFDVEVRLTGEVDEETAFVYDLKKLKQVIKEEVEDRFDHKNLNLDVEEFKDLQPSTEYLAFIIHGLISKRIGPSINVSIRLWESHRNSVQYPAAD